MLIIFTFSISCQQKDNEFVSGQNNLQQRVTSEKKLNTDLSTIDNVMETLYTSISFKENSKPHLSRLRTLFTQNAAFVRITQDTVLRMNREIFISSFERRIASNQLTSFYESEIKRRTMKWGSMAQVFSSYKKAFNSKQPSEFIRGINSIQLFYDGKRWWITSIIWEEETAARSLPKEFS